MAEAYIYDAVRTPRGRGKAGGALCEMTPIGLAAAALKGPRLAPPRMPRDMAAENRAFYPP